MLKGKILHLLKLPPPITGATLMNKYVAESKLLNNNYTNRLIQISYKTSLKAKKQFTLSKIWVFLSLHFKLFKDLLLYKPTLVYFQISPIGPAFIRDCTYIFIIKLFNTANVVSFTWPGNKRGFK